MYTINIMKLFSTLIFFVCLSVVSFAQASPGVTVLGVKSNSYMGNLPQVDGFTDKSFQERINSSLKTVNNDLRNAAKGKTGIVYSYDVLMNSEFMLSLIVKASDSSNNFIAARSFNVDIKTGDVYSLDSLFKVDETFTHTVEKELGWKVDNNATFGLSQQGLVFINQTSGQKQIVGYEKVFNWIVIGRAGYFLDGYRITIDGDEKVLHAKKGNLVVLYLESNKSSGFSWQMKNTDYTSVLKYIGASYLLDSAMIGSSGWELLIFGVQGEGETTIELEYKRKWEKQAIKKLTVTIVGEK